MIESAKSTMPDVLFGPEDIPWQKTFTRLRLLDRTPRVSPPSGDPRTSYSTIPEIPYCKVQIPPNGLDEERYAEAESLFRAHLDRQSNHALGYQLTSNLNYQCRLGHYLDQHLTNIGDPFESRDYTPNSKVLERSVLDYFASLWNAKWPHDPDDPASYWGYLLTMGASEGNLYGVWNARDCLSGRRRLRWQPREDNPGRVGAGRIVYTRAVWHEGQCANAFHPVAFFSQDTHYSLTKAVQVLGVDTFYTIGSTRYSHDNPLAPGKPWPVEVPSVGGVDGTGAIDADKLAVLVRFFASRGYPILVNLNYGSTFKGAYDDVGTVVRTVHEICREYGLDERRVYSDDTEDSPYDVRPGYWIHIDGALGAGYAPYLEMARDAGLVESAPPVFDFRFAEVHSITMSGHKWMGAPWPCGVFMTRTGLQMVPPGASEYIGASDTTFAGSRNGFSAVLMWDYLARHSYDEQIRMALETDHMAGYAHERLLALQDELGHDLWVARSPHSLAVRFRRPSEDIIRRYSLSYETVTVDGIPRPYCHLFTMKHVTEELVDALIGDLRRPRAFAELTHSR